MSDLGEFLKKKYKEAAKTGHEIPRIQRISSGIFGIDHLLGGGLPLGRIGEIFGIESGGKSTISLMMCRAVQRQGYDTALIDLERTLDEDLFKKVGVDPDRFYHLWPQYGEEAIDMALDAAEGGAKLIIIDSLAMLSPKSSEEKIDKDSEARDFSGLAGMLNRLKSKITKTIEKTQATLVFINQIRDKVNSMHGGIQAPGGHARSHMCSYRLQITHATKDNAKPGIITTHLTAIKNKTATPGISTSLVIERGVVDTAASLIEGAVTAGVLEKSGSWIKYGPELVQELGVTNPNMAQGAVKAGKLLLENPALYKTIYYRSLLGNGIIEHQIPDFWRGSEPLTAVTAED